MLERTYYFLLVRQSACRPLHCSLLSWKSNGKVSLVLHCSVFTEMLRLVKLPPIDDMNQALMMKTIRLILSYKAALPAGQRA